MIEASYEIGVPDNTRGNTSAWALFLGIVDSQEDPGKRRLGIELGLGLTLSTGHSYLVAVNKVSPPFMRLGLGTANTGRRSRLEALLFVLLPSVLNLLMPFSSWQSMPT